MPTSITAMSPQPGSYYVYLLRLWREQINEEIVWHSSLENAQDGQILGFARLCDLFNFLETVVTGHQKSTDPQEK